MELNVNEVVAIKDALALCPCKYEMGFIKDGGTVCWKQLIELYNTEGEVKEGFKKVISAVPCKDGYFWELFSNANGLQLVYSKYVTVGLKASLDGDEEVDIPVEKRNEEVERLFQNYKSVKSDFRKIITRYFITYSFEDGSVYLYAFPNR